jgi:hypothetical protein
MVKTMMMMVRSSTTSVQTRIRLPVSHLQGRGMTWATNATLVSAAMLVELALRGI